MRRQDELISIYGGQSALGRKFLISQMEGLSRAFDSEELLDFLQGQLADTDATVRSQTLYTVAQFLPGFVQRRYAVSTQTMGTWSTYGAAVGGQPTPSRHDIRKRVKAPKVHQAALLAVRPVIDAIIARLGDLDGWNRTRALLALGHFGLRSSQSWLIDRLRSTRPELAVGLALAEIGSEEASAALLSALKQYGSLVPDLYFLLSPAQGPASASMLLSAIPRTDTIGRMNLARALAGFSVTDIQAAFARLREHKEGWVECFALSSIEAAASPALLPTVIEAHRGARHWFIALAALKAAGGIRSEESIAFCIDALKDPSQRVAAVALESLVRLRTPPEQLRAAALPFLSSPDMKARVNAILAAVDSEDAPEAKPLLEMLVSTEPLSRLEAAYCLGYLQSTRALDLVGMLATMDPSYVVRHQAVKSLSKYPARDALKHLMPIILGEDARLALTAARVVARYEDDDARLVGQTLAEALKSARTNFTRTVLYRSLGQVTSRADFPEGRAALTGGLAEPEPKVLSGVLSGWVLAGPGGADFAANLLADPSLEKTPRLRARLLLARWNCGDLDAPARLAEMLRGGEPEALGPALDAVMEISLMLGEAAIGLRFPELAGRLSERTKAPDFEPFVDAEGEAPPIFKERLRLPEIDFEVRLSGQRRAIAAPPGATMIPETVPDVVVPFPLPGTKPPSTPSLTDVLAGGATLTFPTHSMPRTAGGKSGATDVPGAAQPTSPLGVTQPAPRGSPAGAPPAPPRPAHAASPAAHGATASPPTPLEPIPHLSAPANATLTNVQRSAPRKTRPAESLPAGQPGGVTVPLPGTPRPQRAQEALRELFSRPVDAERDGDDAVQDRLQKVTYLVPDRFAGEDTASRVLRHPLTWLTAALMLAAVLVPLSTRSSSTPSEETALTPSLEVPDGFTGHLWFATLDGPCYVRDSIASLLMPVRPGQSVQLRNAAEATLKTPTDDTITMRGPASFVLDSVTQSPRGKHPRYRLRQVAGELQLEFQKGAEVAIVLDQRTVETSAGSLKISRTSKGAQELQLLKGDATMVDPLGRMEITPSQRLLYDE